MSAVTARPARPVTPVSIVADTLDHVAARLRDVDGVPADVLADLDRARAVAGGLDPYLEACTSPASPALDRLAARTRSHDWDSPTSGGARLEQEMLSGHVEGRLLAMLVRLTRARRVLEVGMFTGYSALAMAEALPPDGRLLACELDPDVAAFARECFAASEAAGRIEVAVGPAADTLDRLARQGRSFDLVFLDADKPGYQGYLDVVLDSGLLTPDGLVCVDNTLLQGEPWAADEPSPAGAAIAAFNRALAGDPRVEQVLLPVRDGLTLVRRA